MSFVSSHSSLITQMSLRNVSTHLLRLSASSDTILLTPFCFVLMRSVALIHELASVLVDCNATIEESLRDAEADL